MRINLQSLINDEVKVFSGRDVGEEFRKKKNLDELDKASEPTEIVVPKGVYSINASFFLGMFGPSVRSLGEQKFRSQYKFLCEPVINKNIEDGISRALKDSNALKMAKP